MKTGRLFPRETFNRVAWADNYLRTNCYAFALGEVALGCAHPGKLMDPEDSMLGEKNIRTDKVSAGTIKDGAIPITEEEALSDKFKHVIALRVAPGKDFHYFRKLGDIWLHKPNNKPVDFATKSGKVITNPRLVFDKFYKDFGGYYALPEDGIPYVDRTKDKKAPTITQPQEMNIAS